MTTPNSILLTAFFLLGGVFLGKSGACVLGQEYESLALHAYLQNDLSKWEAALDATSYISDPEQRLLTRAEFQLGRAYAAMAASDEEAVDRALDDIDEAMEELWEINDKNAVAHGVYSGYLGLKIARKPISGMIYGSRATKYAAKAARLGPKSGPALYHAASNLFYTPEQWGGDAEQALKYLERAVAAYGPHRNQNWRYLNTLALLGQVQARLGQVEQARATYSLALKAQPGFDYVSKVLLPQLDRS